MLLTLQDIETTGYVISNRYTPMTRRRYTDHIGLSIKNLQINKIKS